MKLSSEIIKIGENMYRVHDYTTPDDLQLGNAYIFGGDAPGGRRIRFNYVLPFRGGLSTYDGKPEPGIYRTVDDPYKLTIIYPRTDREQQIYSTSRIFHLGPNTISGLTEYLGTAQVSDLQSASNIFRPVIFPEDDVGVKALRLAINKKNTDLDSYDGKFNKPWDKANLKKALTKDHSLSFSKLKEYADIFDLEHAVLLFDREGAKDPMFPGKKKAIAVFNDEVFPIEDNNIDIITSIDDVLDKQEGD